MIQLLLVSQMNSQWWIHINVKLKDSTCRVDSICGCNIGDEGGDEMTQQILLISVSMWVIL